MLRMPADWFLVQALPVQEELNIGANNRFHHAKQPAVQRALKECSTGLVAACEHHNLFIAVECRRRRKEESTVWRHPSLRYLLCAINQGDSLCGCSFDIAMNRLNIVLKQPAHHQASMLLIDCRRTLYIHVVCKDFKVSDCGRSFFGGSNRHDYPPNVLWGNWVMGLWGNWVMR